MIATKPLALAPAGPRPVATGGASESASERNPWTTACNDCAPAGHRNNRQHLICVVDTYLHPHAPVAHASAPPGQASFSHDLSTGCAAPAKTRAALHPWLQPCAPLGLVQVPLGLVCVPLGLVRTALGLVCVPFGLVRLLVWGVGSVGVVGACAAAGDCSLVARIAARAGALGGAAAGVCAWAGVVSAAAGAGCAWAEIGCAGAGASCAAAGAGCAAAEIGCAGAGTNGGRGFKLLAAVADVQCSGKVAEWSSGKVPQDPKSLCHSATLPLCHLPSPQCPVPSP